MVMAYTNISIVTLSSKTKSSFQCRGVLAGTGVRHSREARKTGKKLGEMRTFMYRSNYPAFTKEEIRYIIQSRFLRRCFENNRGKSTEKNRTEVCADSFTSLESEWMLIASPAVERNVIS